MKRISSKHNAIEFAVDSNTKLVISSDGIIVSDDVASFVYKRLGDANISISDIDIDDAVKSVLGSGQQEGIINNI